MIKINLLPSETGKRAGAASVAKQKPPQSAARMLYMLLFLLYLGAVAAGYYVWQISDRSTKAVAARQASKETMEKKVAKRRAELNAATENSREIEEKYEVAMALSPVNRVFWSEKLNMLSRARMNLGVYMTRLQLDEDISEIETPESVARREEWKKQKHEPGEQEPKAVKRPIINQKLTVEAIAYGNDDPQRLRQIIAFQNVLARMKWTRESGKESMFLDGLKPEFGQLLQKRDVVGGVEVMRFGFICEAEPQTDNTGIKTEPGAPATGAPANSKGGN